VFVPLLRAARESFNTIERLCERGEKRKDACAERHAIGCVVMRDSSLLAGGKGARMITANYTVDLEQRPTCFEQTGCLT